MGIGIDSRQLGFRYGFVVPHPFQHDAHGCVLLGDAGGDVGGSDDGVFHDAEVSEGGVDGFPFGCDPLFEGLYGRVLESTEFNLKIR